MLAATALVAATFLPAAHAQTSGGSSQKAEESATSGQQNEGAAAPSKSNDDKKEEPKPLTAAQKQAAEQAELDQQLLGAWVFLANESDPSVSNATARAAAARCRVPGANGTGTQTTGGDIMYFRSAQGLQRLEITKGKISLFTEQKRVEDRSRGVIWGLANGSQIMAVRISDVDTQAGRVKVMLEDTRLYLRCQGLFENNG